uniref:VP7 n=1 Tax=Macrostomum lignano TaxID=282301 RepID=A0A1I8HGY9_9PLAT
TPVSANISPGAIPFDTPDITVCNVSPISSTNYYETVTKHYDVYMRLLSEAYSTQSVVESHGFGYNTDILMQVSRDMFDSSLLLRYLGHRREYFIVRCRYKGQECSYANFQNFWDSQFGNCFRFQPSEALLNATRDVAEFQLELVLFTDTNPVVTHPYSMEVYRMLTAGVTFEGEYDVSKSGGAILFYGDKDHYPRDYINLSPGVHSYVDFQMVEHRYVSRNSKVCIEDSGIAYYEDSDRNRIKFRKNRIDCQYRTLLEKIMADCDCFSTRIAPPYVNLTETFTKT